MLIRMELARIIISEIDDQQLIYLREVDGERVFPILIGFFEATSIDRRVKGEQPMRPLTHDLIKGVVCGLGGEIEDVVVNNLIDHTYYAVLRIRANGELIEVDCRPSDAVAIAMHHEPPLPIYVDDTVLSGVA